jgi:hypothetical protein
MTYPIVALWSHPRSMSTATERIMRERGDCTVFHEPFLVDYYLHRAVREMPMLDEDKAKPHDYDTVRAMLLDAGEQGAVFFKDMSYYVVPRIFADAEFCRRLCNVFLIRDPRRSIASYHKLDPDVTSWEIGLEAQWQHYCFLHDELGLAPMVIEAEAVAGDPPAVIGRLWDRAGLPFIDSAFDWGDDTVPDGWQHVEGWHKKVLSSTGIRKDDSDPAEVFEKAARTAPHLRDLLDHHWRFYEKLRQASVT